MLPGYSTYASIISKPNKNSLKHSSFRNETKNLKEIQRHMLQLELES